MPEHPVISESFARWVIGGLVAAVMALTGWGWQQHEEVQRLRLELALVQVELHGIDKALTDMGLK
jgi:hypothetical protein